MSTPKRWKARPQRSGKQGAQSATFVSRSNANLRKGAPEGKNVLAQIVCDVRPSDSRGRVLADVLSIRGVDGYLWFRPSDSGPQGRLGRGRDETQVTCGCGYVHAINLSEVYRLTDLATKDRRKPLRIPVDRVAVTSD